ncbi:MAG: hypothetical protein LBC53_02890 [Spirochaetaceae bacterium]|jgi:tetratricopeptide (TPR) repeat protein|nr:hypothetical protein [Spirochaetaceae bacterium]
MKLLKQSWTAFKTGAPAIKTGVKTAFFAVFAIFSGVFTAPLCAQNWNSKTEARPFWYVLEEGKRNFGKGEYGAALLDFEDARNARLAMYTRMEQDMIDVLSISEVRRYKDDLTLVENYIKERGQFRAGEALNELYYRVGKENLKNSVNNVLQTLKTLKAYPEADYWIGETYRMEGELAISEKQYRKALQNRNLMESPALVLEIEYKLALILKEMGRFQEMEECYDEIFKKDALWRESERFVRGAMTRTLKTDGVNAFLVMYRYKNSQTEHAHREAGFYYINSGRHEKALDHLMFAFLIQNSTIIEEVIRKQFDYTFTNLNDLQTALERKKELKNYMQTVEYYRTLYSLALALYATGEEKPAREIWAFTAGAAEAGEWAGRSLGQLKKPHVEKPAESR